MLKFTAEKAVAELGIQASVFPGSIDRYGMEKADMYLIPYGLNASAIRQQDVVVSIQNVLDVEEIKRAILSTLRHMNGGEENLGAPTG